MQVSFWFSTNEKTPPITGVYFACMINTIDNTVIPGFYNWNRENALWSTDKGIPVDIEFWTFADPYLWYEFDYPGTTYIQSFNAAQTAALQEVFDATERFNLISKLSEK